MIEYSSFKALQFLLFWGAALGFCIWQLRSLQRLRRQRAKPSKEPLERRRQTAGEQPSD